MFSSITVTFLHSNIILHIVGKNFDFVIDGVIVGVSNDYDINKMGKRIARKERGYYKVISILNTNVYSSIEKINVFNLRT